MIPAASVEEQLNPGASWARCDACPRRKGAGQVTETPANPWLGLLEVTASLCSQPGGLQGPTRHCWPVRGSCRGSGMPRRTGPQL